MSKRWEFPYSTAAVVAAGLSTLAAVAWMALALVVLVRRSRDLFGLLLSAGFFSIGVVTGTFTEADHIIAIGRLHPWAPPWPATVVLVAEALSLPWAYCFPDGRFVPRATMALGAAWAVLWLWPTTGAPLIEATGASLLLFLIIVCSTGVSFIYRYWRRSTAVQRQQLKWVLLGGLVFLVIYLLQVPLQWLILPVQLSSEGFLLQLLQSAVFSLAVIALPVVLATAIFRQGLLDIDLIINRTLAYGAITAVLAIGFVAISAASNLVLVGFTGHRSEWALLAAVVPVALAFMPMRARALKIADHFVTEDKVMTLLFLDIVGSTDRAYALGDRSWRELLERFRSTVRRCVKRYGGREVDTTGDAFFLTFAGPEQALRCAHDLIRLVRTLALEIRVGVHIGRVQADGTHVAGANVHLAARVMSAAGAGEVYVSRALRDVLAGSEITFKDEGVRELKGVPGDMQLYSAFA